LQEWVPYQVAFIYGMNAIVDHVPRFPMRSLQSPTLDNSMLWFKYKKMRRPHGGGGGGSFGRKTRVWIWWTEECVNKWELVGWSNISAQASNGVNIVIEEHMHLLLDEGFKVHSHNPVLAPFSYGFTLPQLYITSFDYLRIMNLNGYRMWSQL